MTLKILHYREKWRSYRTLITASEFALTGILFGRAHVDSGLDIHSDSEI